MLHVVLETGPLVQEKALKLISTLYSDCNATSLQATSGWFDKYCCIHVQLNLSLLMPSGIDAFQV